MSVFSHPAFEQHEQVHFCQDQASGLKAIIAIHDTRLGPALGGCRMHPYACDDEAIGDALRLSQGMTYKSAMAGLPYGGGKAVIIGDPAVDKNDAMLRAMGRFIDQLGGHYISAEDVGTTVADLRTMGQCTEFVAGINDRVAADGSVQTGDPSPATAYGVYVGIKAAVQHRYGHTDFHGLRVTIQGLGKVGYRLAQLLSEAGAQLYVSDLNIEQLQNAVNHLGATALTPQQLLTTETDIFVPCAMGGIIDQQLLDQLPVSIIAGSANNQLAQEDMGELLRQRDILYAPDFVINGGGIIDVVHGLTAQDRTVFDPSKVTRQLDNIGLTLQNIFRRAQLEQCSTTQVAYTIARERIQQMMQAA